jgi:vacuolar-type H+-ATPase subunit E/Vma4
MILKEAKETAKQVIQEAQKSAEETLEKQKQLGIRRAKQSAQTLLRKAETEAKLDKINRIANAKIKANWIILSKKETWIDNVLNEVKNELKILTESKEYIPILEKLIIEASIILKGKELEVILNEKDSKLPLNFNKLAEAISEKTGFKPKFNLSQQKAKAIGGAIIKTDNGKVIMDNTFEDILLRREKKLRFETAKILFKR